MTELKPCPVSILRQPEVLDRFWSKVAKGPASDCWLWSGRRDHHGRATFWLPLVKKHIFAARAVLALEGGYMPGPETFACHTCDNPACVNPGHLWWGNRSDNMKDCGAKGRHGFQTRRLGGNNPQAKLSENDVRAIRLRYQNGERPGVIGRDYGILSQSVWKIAARKAWRHVD